MIDSNGYLERFEGNVNWSARGLEILYDTDCEIELRKMVGRLLSERGFTIERLWYEYILNDRVLVILDQEGIHMKYKKSKVWLDGVPTIFWGDEDLHYLWDHIRALWKRSM